MYVCCVACGNSFAHVLTHPRAKIRGAVQYCERKRMWKKCIYEGTKKYLVITSDRVERLGVGYTVACCFVLFSALLGQLNPWSTCFF